MFIIFDVCDVLLYLILAMFAPPKKINHLYSDLKNPRSYCLAKNVLMITQLTLGPI